MKLYRIRIDNYSYTGRTMFLNEDLFFQQHSELAAGFGWKVANDLKEWLVHWEGEVWSLEECTELECLSPSVSSPPPSS